MALFVTRSTRVADTTGPTAPTIVVTPASTSTITVQRTVLATDASGIQSYETQRSLTGTGSWTTFDTSNTNPLTAAGLTPSTTLDFRQRGIDAVGNLGVYSATVTATTNASAGSGNNIVPTHYVSTSASGGGNGTVGNPYTLAQALALAQPGWRVQMAAGTYIGTNTNSAFGACFRVTNAGQDDNRIIFFAENYAAFNATGRTILQNNAATQGSGCPVLGVGSGHEWIGIYINEDQARTHADTGPVVMSGTNMAVRYCRISRGNTPWPAALSDNNHAAIRVEPGRNVEIMDNWIENYSGIGASNSEQGIQMFSERLSNGGTTTYDVRVENNYFLNNQVCMTVKGAGSDRPILGGINFRKNICRASSFASATGGETGGVAYMDCGNTQGLNLITQNLFVDGIYGLITFSQAGYPMQGLRLVNNTFVNLSNSGDRTGVHADYFAATSGVDWRYHNNVKTGTAIMDMYSYTADTALTARSHNLCNGNAAGRWALTGTRSESSLAQWQAIGFDASSLTSDPQYVSSTWDNASLGQLGGASPARNAGIDVLQLLGGSASAPINMGAFITSDMSDVLGIRPLS